MSRRTGALVSADRQQRIAELVSGRRSIRVSELVEIFSVSDETIRRDLDALARDGLIRRTHGGAVATSTRHESDYGRRLLEREAEKQAIGRLALDFVGDGSTIILDSGTTVLQLAKAMTAKTNILVVTNAITNVIELNQAPNVSVVMTGGIIRPDTWDAVGDLAVNSLKELHVDQTFLSISAVSIDGGLTYPSLEEIAVKRAMIQAASEVTLLADSSKFDREALVRVAPLSAVARIISTPGLSAEMKRAIADLGIELIVAEVGDDV